MFPLLFPVVKISFPEPTITFGSQGKKDLLPNAVIIEGILKVSLHRKRSQTMPDLRWIVEPIQSGPEN